MQYSCYTKMPLVVTFRPQKRAKVIMITIFKYLEPPIVVEQFEIVLNKLNEKIIIFSHPFNFSRFYRIYFYTHGISSPKCKPVSLSLRHRGFAVQYFNHYVDSTNL